MNDLLESENFKKLEKLYPFLSRAREQTLNVTSNLVTLDKETYVIVDIETTGLDFEKNEIIEIGALKAHNGEIVDIFSTLIKPSTSLPAKIIEITGLSDEMLYDQPSMSTVAPQFLKFIDGSLLVAHNTDFDIPFLKHHVKQNFTNFIVCTLKLSRLLMKNLQNHKLKTVAQGFGITAQNQHRAIGDVETTFQIWQKMIPMLKDRKIMTKEDLKKFVG